ncbi:MAG: mitochondrial fission ELM1 family protein [Kiritimatiellae bacterium]|nr:mitochondrial fission ELM1 family protein [Kiritimatiellia bacterium]
MATALILSDGKPGHENQSKALAEGLGFSFQIQSCVYPNKLKKTFSYLCDRVGITPDLTGILPEVSQRIEAEPPTVVIGAGSNTFYSLKLIRRKFNIPCIAILTPSGYSLDGFDVILAPAFDNPPLRDNVIVIPTNLTPARPDFYREQTQAFLERYTPQKKRAVGVIIGGKNPIADVTAPWLQQQLTQLFDATPDCEHWVTTSRRTSPEADAIIDSFPFDYKLIFSRERFNPIPAFVTQCDYLFVTAESTGMLSEAVAVGSANVEVLDNLSVTTGKFARFVQQLCEEHYAHRFDGTLGSACRKVDLVPILGRVQAVLAQASL